MKITFTFGNTVKTILNQDTDGYYVYTPDNSITLPIKFYYAKDAITFFSNFLPTKVYDKDENSLSFMLTVEYEGKTINFCMIDEDRTKIAWTDYSSDIKGFNDFWSKNRKVDDSIDDVVWYFIKWVKQESSKTNVVKNNDVGIIFDYKGVISKVKRYNENGYYNCDVWDSKNRVQSASLDTLYKKFKTAIDEYEDSRVQ